MAVKVNIHTTHRPLTNGLEVVSVEGSTVGECLAHLIRQYPGMEKALFAKKAYARAWKELHLCRKYGGSPPPALIRDLSSRMPDPGP